MSRRFFVYILSNTCHGVLYVGVTNDLARRVAQHKAKVVPGFTKTYGVLMLVYYEEYSSILGSTRTRGTPEALAASMEIRAYREAESGLA